MIMPKATKNQNKEDACNVTDPRHESDKLTVAPQYLLRTQPNSLKVTTVESVCNSAHAQPRLNKIMLSGKELITCFRRCTITAV